MHTGRYVLRNPYAFVDWHAPPYIFTSWQIRMFFVRIQGLFYLFIYFKKSKHSLLLSDVYTAVEVIKIGKKESSKYSKLSPPSFPLRKDSFGTTSSPPAVWDKTKHRVFYVTHQLNWRGRVKYSVSGLVPKCRRRRSGRKYRKNSRP